MLEKGGGYRGSQGSILLPPHANVQEKLGPTLQDFTSYLDDKLGREFAGRLSVCFNLPIQQNHD